MCDYARNSCDKMPQPSWSDNSVRTVTPFPSWECGLAQSRLEWSLESARARFLRLGFVYRETNAVNSVSTPSIITHIGNCVKRDSEEIFEIIKIAANDNPVKSYAGSTALGFRPAPGFLSRDTLDKSDFRSKYRVTFSYRGSRVPISPAEHNCPTRRTDNPAIRANSEVESNLRACTSSIITPIGNYVKRKGPPIAGRNGRARPPRLPVPQSAEYPLGESNPCSRTEKTVAEVQNAAKMLQICF